jgi:hypothetical protein
MILDDLLMAIIIAGVGLSLAYLRAEYVFNRRPKAAARRDALILRELHANRLIGRRWGWRDTGSLHEVEKHWQF